MLIQNKFISEPYRLFFPLGVFFLLWGSLIWLPMLWNPSQYPVQAHRFLMLNGFSASFIAGFLMTAVPKFSKTESAKFYEVLFFFLATIFGLIGAFLRLEKYAYLFSALQAFLILSFLLMRVFHRKENPPYSFVFIFVGLILWIISAMVCSFNPTIPYKSLHYEGAISAIILGVGSRLIPGILGHMQIVQTQRSHYENSKAFLLTVPLHFYAMIGLFLGSYFFENVAGLAVRACIVTGIALYYWRLYQAPKEKTALTWCIWISCWLIVASFLLKVLWYNGAIHASHAFFLSGIVLLSLLIATRVLQSHGPQMKSLENLKRLYVVTGLVLFAGATRVSAFLMPAHYLKHLGYSSIVLSAAILLWSFKYLPFIFIKIGDGGKK